MTLTYEITPKFLTDRFTAVMRAELPPAEMPDWLEHAYRTVYSYLRQARIVAIGPPFARFTFIDGLVAVEAGFPVRREIPGDGVVEPSRLPDGPAATTEHRGRYEDLDRAFEAVQSWLENLGYEAAGPHWEVYHTDPHVEPDPTRWCTEVVVPYRLALGGP
jgi:effector-binding domain-containing protein